MLIVTVFEHMINWLSAKLNRRQFLIFSSMLVGLTGGFAAVILKTLVHYLHLLLTTEYYVGYQYVYPVFPLVGILISVYFVNKFLDGKLGRGTSNIIHSIIKKSALLPKDQMYSHIVTSAITVGFGGSAGLESPIVTTGSAIGSNYARTYQMSYKNRVLLLACGAAAGIAGAFNAPITGVLFALEVLLVNVAISAFIPVMISAAIGALCSKIILGEDILLSFRLQQPFNYHNLPFYILLGIAAGWVSVYYARMFSRVEKWFERYKVNAYRKAIVGGLIVGALIFLFPSLFGEGYNSIKMLADMKAGEILKPGLFGAWVNNKWGVLLLVGIILFVKVFATSITINSGGNGGNFAPSLFVGAYLGFFFCSLVNLLGLAELPESNFTIVGMCGILTGVFHAPLTGIFLIAEITGGYDLMIPLMVVSAISFTVVKYFEPYSMDEKKLAKKRHILTQDKDKTILSSLKISKIIETDFAIASLGDSLRNLTQVVARSRRNIFPVIDEHQQLVGIILLDEIREIIFKTELYDKVTVQDLMQSPPAIIDVDKHDIHFIMKKFDETKAWNLPVTEAGKYVGFISKSGLLAKYRSQLIRTSSE